MKGVKAIVIKEAHEDELKGIEETISDLNKENELLKMEVWYLGAKKQNIDNRYLEKSRLGKINQTFDARNDTMVTIKEENWDFNNISAIQPNREWLIEEDQEIDEIKEENEEDEQDREQLLVNSKSLKIESLTNESTWYKSNLKSALKTSNNTDENTHPNFMTPRSQRLQASANTEYQWKLKEYKSEIKRLLKERNKARLSQRSNSSED